MSEIELANLGVDSERTNLDVARDYVVELLNLVSDMQGKLEQQAKEITALKARISFLTDGDYERG